MYRPSQFDLIKQRYEQESKRILNDEQEKNLALIIKIVREIDRKRINYTVKPYNPNEPDPPPPTAEEIKERWK